MLQIVHFLNKVVTLFLALFIFLFQFSEAIFYFFYVHAYNYIKINKYLPSIHLVT